MSRRTVAGRDFPLTLFGWLLAVGMYLLIRHFHTQETTVWAVYPVTYVWAWLAASGLLAVADHLTELGCASRRFRRLPYLYHHLLKAGGMFLALVIALLSIYLLAASLGALPMREIPGYFLDPLLIISMIYILLMSALFGFIRQVRNMVGSRVLRNLMLGRYRHPSAEDRVFMFVDLKDSTTHAERLGHARFSQLIQDCFEDLTESVLSHEVEIYQYVGDEAILTWLPDEARRNANCLHAFFDFMQSLQERADYYQSTYGLVPAFKAGANIGEVTVLEVGIIKREISYLSDVLNTAARLEGKCNELGESLLCSQDLIDHLDLTADLEINPVGSLSLRGKDEQVQIVAVRRTEGRTEGRSENPH